MRRGGVVLYTEAEGRREVTQHGALPCLAGGEGRGKDDLYCDGQPKPCRTPAQELFSYELLENPAAAAADVLLNVHKTPT
jgi:hypothetical protein